MLYKILFVFPKESHKLETTQGGIRAFTANANNSSFDHIQVQPFHQTKQERSEQVRYKGNNSE